MSVITLLPARAGAPTSLRRYLASAWCSSPRLSQAQLDVPCIPNRLICCLVPAACLRGSFASNSLPPLRMSSSLKAQLSCSLFQEVFLHALLSVPQLATTPFLGLLMPSPGCGLRALCSHLQRKIQERNHLLKSGAHSIENHTRRVTS